MIDIPTDLFAFLDLFDWKSRSQFAFMLMGIVTGAVRYSKLTAPTRLMWLLILISLIIEIYAMLFYKEFEHSNPVYHVYAPIRFTLIGMIYYNYFHRMKRWIIPIIVLIIFICVLISIKPHFLKLFPSASFLITGSGITIFTLFSFAEMLKKPSTEKLMKQPLFWFNTANLIFTTSTFVFLGFYHSIPKDIYKLFLLEVLFIANLILYFFYFLMLWLDGRTVNTSNMFSND